jgi:hypothetical protein
MCVYKIIYAHGEDQAIRRVSKRKN